MLKYKSLPALKPKEKLIRLTEIIDKVVDASTVLDDQTRLALKGFSMYARDFLARTPKASSYQITALTSGLLDYWNQRIKPEIVIFWTELKNNGIELERKNPLQFALEKNRFRTVELGIDARNNWETLKKSDILQATYSQDEIEKIDKIIAEDENRRLGILKKYLKKKEIPRSQYLKFGECMAYFANCHLFEKYFLPAEIEELHSLWKTND